jgi:hypothetical protein
MQYIFFVLKYTKLIFRGDWWMQVFLRLKGHDEYSAGENIY